MFVIVGKLEPWDWRKEEEEGRRTRVEMSKDDDIFFIFFFYFISKHFNELTSRVHMLVKYVVHSSESIIFTQSRVSSHGTTGLGHRGGHQAAWRSAATPSGQNIGLMRQFTFTLI